MNELIEKIGLCVERGKVNKASPYPASMKGLEGADEFTQAALAQGVGPEEILQSCIGGMTRVGDKFSRNEVFVPEMLMAAKAMKTVTAHLKPFFQAGSVHVRGTFLVGTVAGDLHDIGKNLVSMFIEGNGWKVIDLGVDVKPSKFIDKIKEHPECVVGLSALLTTTIASMQNTVREIRCHFPETKIIVGGAPLTHSIAMGMGANAYARDPQGAVAWLSELKQAA
jgi:methanogenic corrinoid protein MtbC1